MAHTEEETVKTTAETSAPSAPEATAKDAHKIPEQSWILEGSSAPKRRKLEFKYTPKDAARYIKYTKVLLPPPVDLQTAAIHVGGGIAIDKLATTVEKKLTAKSIAKQAEKTTVKTAARIPSATSGHIGLSPSEFHITGPEPAILPKMPVPKAPVPLRPVMK